ncbi:hypothetical protein [Actinomycetospora flava]|uniref:Uncharacterized protein n=1 Tax=Actinomycetospora flava TaxID=3129232 RepID=A0ABU8M6W2_9PSEU
MQLERDLWDVLADARPDDDLDDHLHDGPDDPGTRSAFSEWLGGRDLEQLAAAARVARFTGDSFGRRLRADRRGE